MPDSENKDWPELIVLEESHDGIAYELIDARDRAEFDSDDAPDFRVQTYLPLQVIRERLAENRNRFLMLSNNPENGAELCWAFGEAADSYTDLLATFPEGDER